MDGRERFLLVPLDIGEEDDVDILVGVATKHRAHAGVDAFLLREHNVPDAINSEPQPMPIHLVPGIHPVVDHLGSKERARRLRREQAPCLGFPQKPVRSPAVTYAPPSGQPMGG